MLFEPGPLRLFTEAEFPRAGEPLRLEGIAAQLAADLDAHASALGGQQLTMSAGLASGMEGDAALDLAELERELAGQAGALDFSIGDVAAAAGVQEYEIAGLSNDAAQDIADAELPPAPTPPDRTENEDRFDPEFVDIVRGYYLKFLGRDANDDEIESHRGNPSGFAGILAVIFASDEYKQRLLEGIVAPTTVPPIGGGGGGGSSTPTSGKPNGETLLALYAEENPSEKARIQDFLVANPGDFSRAVTALGLPGWNDFLARHGWR
jgi:hypothetical protein